MGMQTICDICNTVLPEDSEHRRLYTGHRIDKSEIYIKLYYGEQFPLPADLCDKCKLKVLKPVQKDTER